MICKKCFLSSFRIILTSVLLSTVFSIDGYSQSQVLAHWRFEQIQHVEGEPTLSLLGQPLTAGERGPVEPQPYVFDNASKGNFLQVRGTKKPLLGWNNWVCFGLIVTEQQIKVRTDALIEQIKFFIKK